MAFRLYENNEEKFIFDESFENIGYMLKDIPKVFNLTDTQKKDIQKIIEETETFFIKDEVLSYLSDNNISYINVGEYVSNLDSAYITLEEYNKVKENYTYYFCDSKLDIFNLDHEKKQYIYEYSNDRTHSNDVLCLDDLSETTMLDEIDLHEELKHLNFSANIYKVLKGANADNNIEYYLITIPFCNNHLAEIKLSSDCLDTLKNSIRELDI